MVRPQPVQFRFRRFLTIQFPLGLKPCCVIGSQPRHLQAGNPGPDADPPTGGNDIGDSSYVESVRKSFSHRIDRV